MSEFQLYCFAQSGNAYRAALMLNLIGADWQPVYVDFFKGGETRTPKYRSEVNEMGEVPVLVHGMLNGDGSIASAYVFRELGIMPCASLAQAQAPGEGDPYAATRRAIVRAAAEIGRAMK